MSKPNLWALPARAVRQDTREFTHPALDAPLKLTVRELGFIGRTAAAELADRYIEQWVKPKNGVQNAYPCPAGDPVLLTESACRTFALLEALQCGPEEDRLNFSDLIALAVLAEGLFDEISDWAAPFGDPRSAAGNGLAASSVSTSAPPPPPATGTPN